MTRSEESADRVVHETDRPALVFASSIIVLHEDELTGECVRPEVVGGLRAGDDIPPHDDSGFTKGGLAAVTVGHTPAVPVRKADDPIIDARKKACVRSSIRSSLTAPDAKSNVHRCRNAGGV